MTPPAAAAAPAPARPGWLGRLEIDYRRDARGATTALDRHEGPLRVLQRLYPEGPGICHHVLLHPPGGLVGGDRLEVHARLQAGAHAVVTTPGAARLYRSSGATATQQVELELADGARLEWLPLETLAYSGCRAENRLRLRLAPGAQALGWDVLALGLPAAGRPFLAGHVTQHLELPGVWLERGRIDAGDAALLDGGPGLAGHRVLATLWLAAGSAFAAPRREALLEAARAAIAAAEADALPVFAGTTAVHPQVLVLRLLAQRVEPALALLARVRAAWRQALWGLAAEPPRIWRT